MSSALDQLALRLGFGEAYHDFRGQLRTFGVAPRQALLGSLGIAAGDQIAAERSLAEQEQQAWSRLLPPVHIVREETVPAIAVTLQEPLARQVVWTLRLEEADILQGYVATSDLQVLERRDGHARLVFPLPAALPQGYHRLSIRTDQGHLDECSLIVAPARCYEPPALEEYRAWGLTVQLYTLRSERNWGMGDLADLRDLIELAAPLGCTLIGLNPLHALRPADPSQCSPYSPSSRQFLNVLYIAVNDVPELYECEPAQDLIASASFRAQLAALRARANVDHAGVARLKLTVLEDLYECFRQHHLGPGTPRGQEFRSFVERGGQALLLHALYDALDRHFRRRHPDGWGWPSWPAAYQNPHDPAVQKFAAAHRTEVEFHLYLQWLVTGQLAQAQRLAVARGMAIGLYGDVAVGVSPGGSETWSNRELFVEGAGIGAPPDPLALKGQDWGIPPQNPRELVAQAYRPFIDMLRANMRNGGALRLDHVMALFRQWWVPRGFTATDGVYVHYPLDDLMRILALESWRQRCMVIGEDLGTVPDTVRESMERYAVAHYKVLLFEREQDESFKAPSRYAERALATLVTHDLPTFRGWWEGVDLELAVQLDLFPDADTRQRVASSRSADRRRFMAALVSAGLWHWQEYEPLPSYSEALLRAAHLYLGLSRAKLAVMQVEDLAGERTPVNVPGTSSEYPNWQRKIGQRLADIFARDETREALDAMGKARRGVDPNRRG